MKRVHYSVQRVSHAMRQTVLRNGGTERYRERAVVRMIKAADCHSAICTLRRDAVELVLSSIESSGFTSIEGGMLSALPGWISAARTARKLRDWGRPRGRIKRLARTMTIGAIDDRGVDRR